jgi:hypothetical protein
MGVTCRGSPEPADRTAPIDAPLPRGHALTAADRVPIRQQAGAIPDSARMNHWKTRASGVTRVYGGHALYAQVALGITPPAEPEKVTWESTEQTVRSRGEPDSRWASVRTCQSTRYRYVSAEGEAAEGPRRPRSAGADRRGRASHHLHRADAAEPSGDGRVRSGATATTVLPVRTGVRSGRDRRRRARSVPDDLRESCATGARSRAGDDDAVCTAAGGGDDSSACCPPVRRRRSVRRF